MSKAIESYKDTIGAQRVRLFGYSGGGAIASLVASRRSDVVHLVTIAAPLDHVVWTRHHKITALSGSLNPKDFADQLFTLPQTHFIGEDDTIVPSSIALSFLRNFPDGAPAKILQIPNYGHKCCWEENWERRLRDINL
jgi:pimeloyl-ACP methyl ester carboxylesterase